MNADHMSCGYGFDTAEQANNFRDALVLMPIDTAYFRTHPLQAQDFIQGRDGKVLKVIAAATALTNQEFISGHLIFGGGVFETSGFMIHPYYQDKFDHNETTVHLAALAPFLAEFELLGQSNYEAHRAAIARASRAFGTNRYIDDPHELVRQIMGLITQQNNQNRYADFMELIKINYDLAHTAIASGQYYIGEYTVISSTILTSFCGTSLSDRFNARLKTRSQKSRINALNRFTQEI